MNAVEARKTATSIAKAEADKKSAELKKRRAALKESVPRLRAERIAKIEKQFRDYIKWAVEGGKTTREITLSSDSDDRLRGQYKYLPSRLDRYYSDGRRSWSHCWGEGYLKYAPWGKYVKLILTKLRREGFKCEVVGVSTHHDDSSAYMNSGGECGSMSTYYTKDTILRISW